MPIKHQQASYRHRRGWRYVCWDDVMEEPIRENAKKVVLALRAQGRPSFYETHDGFCRVFVLETAVEEEVDPIAQSLADLDGTLDSVAEEEPAPELLALAQSALQDLESRKNEDVGEWSKRLAESMVAAGDLPTKREP